MNDGSLSSNARVNFIKKVYMLLTGTSYAIQPS